MTVAEKIKSIRQTKNMTQKQLGELCGIAEPNIRKYELGKQNPKKETLEKIAAALGISINDFYGNLSSHDLSMISTDELLAEIKRRCIDGSRKAV